MLPAETAIRVQNLSKCYHIYDKPGHRLSQFIFPRVDRWLRRRPRNYYREFWALRDVSFEVRKGETVGIIGRNGSGKSTLLQMISGTLSATDGSVETSGRIAALLELGSGFNPEFSGRENVYMNGAVLGLTTEEVDQRFNDIADFAGIGEFIEQPVKTYSSGMMVRLAFAVSVCVEPDILIVDEALAVGDAAFQFKCLDRLRKLTSNGTTLLFVSHDMSMVKNFCDSGIYLQQGGVRATGGPEELAELYLLDMREEQQRFIANAPRVTRKSGARGGSGFAFGTAQGKITDAGIGKAGGMTDVFMLGDTIDIRLAAEYDASVENPSISLIIQDRRLVDIGGKAFPLPPCASGEPAKKAEINVEFPARFTAGKYFVTVRLENRHPDGSFLPVDKQVALLSFDILQRARAFLGTVDVGMRLRPDSGEGEHECQV